MKKFIDIELLINILMLITIAGLSYTDGYLKGIIIEKEETVKLQEKYKELENDYLNYMDYCDKNHYVLYHYGEDGYEVEKKK